MGIGGKASRPSYIIPANPPVIGHGAGVDSWHPLLTAPDAPGRDAHQEVLRRRSNPGAR